MNILGSAHIKQDYTPRELVIAAFEHRETPRTPFSMGFGVNPPARRRLMERLGHRDIKQTDDFLLGFDDVRHLTVPYIGPPERNRVTPDGLIVDRWGVVRKPQVYTRDGAGVYDEICHYPLADARSAADLDAYEWPSPDWYDYESIPGLLRQINPERKYAVRLGNGNIFETTWYMRGFEQTIMDLLLEPELIALIFERVAAFSEAFFERALAAAGGGVDIAFTADDIAGQNGMLFSPDVWRAQIKPWHKHMNALLHEFGAKILYHTDGAAHSVIDDMIDMGVDCWEAVQTDARGMDPAALKRAAGDRLAFHGGISVQQLLPFGTPDEVRSEVSALIKVLGKGGGYIAAPSHAIQAGTPPENILAMLEAVTSAGT